MRTRYRPAPDPSGAPRVRCAWCGVLRPPQRPTRPASSAHCAAPFEARSASARFCSPACRVAAHRAGRRLRPPT
jgi:hypothetical protein